MGRFAVPLILVLLASPLCAQDITASIVGTVTDQSGAAIPGANVTVTHLDTNVVVRKTQTDSDGGYVATLLPIGNYAIKVEMKGFKTFVRSGIELHINDRLTVPITLEVGDVSQEITVEAEATPVELQSPVVAGLVTGEEVRELSLNNRNFLQLIALVPGVTNSGTTDEVYIGTTNPHGTTNVIPFNISGGRNSASNFTVDGADNVDRGSNQTLLSFPNIDSIAEFKVVRGQYSADTGRAGAGQVSVVTRSGGKQLRGSLFEFFRHDKLSANDYFNNARNIARRPLRYHNFGYTISGPIPKLGTANRERHKTFFFWSHEFRRVSTFSTATSYLPTADLKNGIFSAPVCVEFAAGACVAMSNRITNINPVAAAYLKDIWSKLPDGDPVTYLHYSPRRSRYDFRQELIKIDHVLSRDWTIFIKHSRDTIPTEEPGGLFTNSPVPGVANTKTDSPGRTTVVRAVGTISQIMLNEFGVTYSYGAIVSRPTGLISYDKAPNVRPNLPFKSTLTRVPTLAVSGFSSLTGYGPYDDYNRNFNIYDNFTRIMGKTQLRLGFTFNYYQKTENAAGNNVGSFTIPNTPQFGSRPSGVTTYQQAWANFLLGYVSTFTQASLDLFPDMRQKQLEFYVQDDYRATRNLTVNIGVRVSNFWLPYDAKQMLTNFDYNRWDPAKAPQVNAAGNLVPNTGDPLNGIIVNGKDSPYGKKTANEDLWQFAPRVGFAWDPTGKKKTAIRSGYGITYDSTLVGIYEQNIFTNPPFQNSITLTNTRLDNPAAGVESISLAPKVLRTTPIPYMIPYTQQWSFDIQQQFGRRTFFTIGYYGSKATHLIGIVDINTVKPGLAVEAGLMTRGTPITSSTTPRLNAIRPYRGYAGMYSIQNWFNSNYHSLQSSVNRQLGRGSNIRAAYTWSKVLTDSPSDRSHAPQNFYDRKADYARATFDRTHVLTISYIYHLPFASKSKGWVRQAFQGWELSGIMSFSSGLPLRVTSSLGYDWGGLGTLGSSPAPLRTDMVSDPNKNAPHTIAKWFNTEAFVAPPASEVRPGNAPASFAIGPGFQKYDASLFKNFKVNERWRVQFRAEAFNLPNHANWLNPAVGVGGSTFGQITSAREPRKMQMALKVLF